MIWNHIVKQNTTYFKHAYKSLKMGYFSFKGACCSVVHAIYPDILETWTDDMILEIYKNKGANLSDLAQRSE